MASFNKRYESTVKRITKQGAEAVANGVNGIAGVVGRNDVRIADVTEGLTQSAGKGLNLVGRQIDKHGANIGQALNQNAGRAGGAVHDYLAGNGSAGAVRKTLATFAGLTTKAAIHVVGITAHTAALGGRVVAASGRLTEKAAPVVGGTVGGALRGTAVITSNAVDAVALPASRVEELRTELAQRGTIIKAQLDEQMLAIDLAKVRRRKSELLGLLVVGGVTLEQAIRNPASVPPDVERAFELAYPNLAASGTFSETASRMSSDELVGLVAGAKGKLFEMELVEHLNAGGLPEGLHAELAASPTQSGWDVRIVDESGKVSEVFQAKATESVEYVRDALDSYPSIDVVTTSEVYAQLAAIGVVENVRDGGITEEALQAKVEAATGSGDICSSSDLIPSSIGLAVVALSVFMSKTTGLRERSDEFGSRSAKLGVSSAVGKAAMVATQTWWIGLLAGVGSSWLANRGDHKREQYEALRGIVERLRGMDQSAVVVSKRLAFDS